MKSPLLIAALAAGLLAATLPARTVALGRVVCNPGRSVTLPLTLNEAHGLAVVSVVVNYDPALLILTRVRQGSLADRFTLDFTAVEETGSLTLISGAPADITQRGGGTLAELTFHVREGAEAQVADLALADIRFREQTMTADLSLAEATTPANGMIRPLADTGACTDRLGEGPVTIAAGTCLRRLTLAEGDALETSPDLVPIVVTDALAAEGPISLLAPENGWANARYPLLQAPCADLTFALQEAPEQYAIEATTVDGLTTYTLVATVEAPTVEAPEALSPGDCQALLARLEGDLAGIDKVVVQGTQEAIELGLDLGIGPEIESTGGVLTATFAPPTLVVKDFDPKQGIIRVQVKPGAGNVIKGSIITGVLHVHGTERLGGTWNELETLQLDLSEYLDTETLGELEATAELGSHTFVKVVAGRTTVTEAPADSTSTP